MPRHSSRFGTTCWVCGHPGLRGKRIAGVVYQACDACAFARGGIETLRVNRDADVEMLKRESFEIPKDWSPVYWSPEAWVQLWQDWKPHRKWLDKLKCQPYKDDFLELNKERIRRRERAYHKEYYAGLRAERWEERAIVGNQLLEEMKKHE
jgi:hypothetical protein